MELNDKVTQLEDEIKILKNEIQAVLLDLRESYLNNKNPFNVSETPSMNPPPSVSQPSPIQTVPAFNEPVREVSVCQINSEPKNQLTGSENDGGFETEVHIPKQITLDDSSDEMSAIEECEPETKQRQGLEEVSRPPREKLSLPPAKEWRIKPANSGMGTSQNDNPFRSESIEISSVTKLVDWVEESCRQLGAKKTETMLDVAEMIGYIGVDLKAILGKLIGPDRLDNTKVDARDYLASWLKLAKILGKDNKPELALFYMVCQEAENR